MAARKEPKRRPLRPPFLITVATLAGAIAPACGGSVTTNGTGNTGGSAGMTTGSTSTGTTTTGMGTTGTTGGAGGGPNEDCPISQPTNGSSCATEGQRCTYPYCGRPNDLQFTCTGGRWSMQPTGTCNPPPPMCPTVEPTVGSPCSPVPGPCAYTSTCCGVASQHVYGCAGEWGWQPRGDAGQTLFDFDAGVCAPPPPSCPANIPVEGSPCCFNAPLMGSCEYRCYESPANMGYFNFYASCDGKQWRILRDTCVIGGDAGPKQD
jgi:hypothetical protein